MGLFSAASAIANAATEGSALLDAGGIMINLVNNQDSIDDFLVGLFAAGAVETGKAAYSGLKNGSSTLLDLSGVRGIGAKYAAQASIYEVAQAAGFYLGTNTGRMMMLGNMVSGLAEGTSNDLSAILDSMNAGDPYVVAGYQGNEVLGPLVFNTALAPVGGSYLQGMKGVSYLDDFMGAGDSVVDIYRSQNAIRFGADKHTTSNYLKPLQSNSSEFHVIIHGKPLGGFVADNHFLPTSYVADEILASTGFAKGKTICLASCHAGVNGKAQELADLLNSPVRAGNAPVRYNEATFMLETDIFNYPNSEVTIFKPKTKP